MPRWEVFVIPDQCHMFTLVTLKCPGCQCLRTPARRSQIGAIMSANLTFVNGVEAVECTQFLCLRLPTVTESEVVVCAIITAHGW